MTPTKNESLPELPDPKITGGNDADHPEHGRGCTGYTADQMHAHARAALTREAPPEAVVRTPSYEALLIIAQSVCGALARAGIEDCDDPGEAIDVMRERLEARIAELPTQPPHQDRGEVEKRARALLAAEYDKIGLNGAATYIRSGQHGELDKAIIRAIEQAMTQQRGECEDARKFRRLAQLLDGFDFRLGRNALMPPATYLDSVEITCEFQPGIGQSVIDAIVDVLATEKRND